MLKPGYQFCRLNTTDEIESFERALFDAFRVAYPDGFIMNTYHVVDGCRLRPHIPYSDIVIYGLKRHNRLVAATAYNENMSRPLQLEAMGFNIDARRPDHPYSEGLCLFSTLAEYENTVDRFQLLREWGRLTFADMRKRGIGLWFGTCADNMVPFYRALGCEFIDTVDYSGTNLNLFMTKTI